MKTAMVEKKSDLIKMENGKKDLPVGISQTKFGSYRLQRTVNSKKYRFGSTQNLELALSINSGIDELVKDLRTALEEPASATVEQVTSIVTENSATDMLEITRLIEKLIENDKDNLELLSYEIGKMHRRIDKGFHVIMPEDKKSFWQRITGR